jgi:long-chain acyl-CoA synthetase
MIWPLRRAARVAPKQPAVRFEDVELTYAQTWERCRRLAGALRGLGVERGDRVAVVAQNSHRYLELYQAIPGAGMVLVPLNHRHADAEVRYALEDSGARVVFAAREIGGLPASVEHVVDAGDGYEELLDGADPVDFPDDVSEDDLAGIFYTGGTTGGAKGVMLRHRALVSNASTFRPRCRSSPRPAAARRAQPRPCAARAARSPARSS